jgi:PilZ domain
MRLEGRNEKRVTMAIPVRLVAAEKPNVAEQAMTVNVSSRGARILTRRRWQPEEEPRLGLSSGEIRAQTKVVYCEPLGDGRFCIGLKFPSANMKWNPA